MPKLLSHASPFTLILFTKWLLIGVPIQVAFGKWRKRHHFGMHLVPGSSSSPLFFEVRTLALKIRLGGDLVPRVNHGYSLDAVEVRLTGGLILLPL